jgi:hypothetical protein
MKIAIDIDGCISEYPQFFRTLSHALYGASCTVVVLTSRDPAGRAETEADLARWGIRYDELVYSMDKAAWILEQGVAVLFEDYDENFVSLPESVCVCKVREPENFNFETGRWVYHDRTGERAE